MKQRFIIGIVMCAVGLLLLFIGVGNSQEVTIEQLQQQNASIQQTALQLQGALQELKNAQWKADQAYVERRLDLEKRFNEAVRQSNEIAKQIQQLQQKEETPKE